MKKQSLRKLTNGREYIGTFSLYIHTPFDPIKTEIKLRKTENALIKNKNHPTLTKGTCNRYILCIESSLARFKKIKLKKYIKQYIYKHQCHATINVLQLLDLNISDPKAAPDYVFFLGGSGQR